MQLAVRDAASFGGLLIEIIFMMIRKPLTGLCILRVILGCPFLVPATMYLTLGPALVLQHLSPLQTGATPSSCGSLLPSSRMWGLGNHLWTPFLPILQRVWCMRDPLDCLRPRVLCLRALLLRVFLLRLLRPRVPCPRVLQLRLALWLCRGYSMILAQPEVPKEFMLTLMGLTIPKSVASGEKKRIF